MKLLLIFLLIGCSTNRELTRKIISKLEEKHLHKREINKKDVEKILLNKYKIKTDLPEDYLTNLDGGEFLKENYNTNFNVYINSIIKSYDPHSKYFIGNSGSLNKSLDQSKAIFKKNKDTLYIKIESFYTEETKNDNLRRYIFYNIKKYNPSHIIFDLRGNRGGYLKSTLNILKLFIEGDVMFSQDKEGYISYYQNENEPIFNDENIYVLIDEKSASSAEIFAGAIKDSGRGIVIGNVSHGKGTLQRYYKVDEGFLGVTEEYTYSPSGKSFQVKGVIPHIILEDKKEDYKYESKYNFHLPYSEIKIIKDEKFPKFDKKVLGNILNLIKLKEI